MELEMSWPTTWTVFGPFTREEPVPSNDILAAIPKTLTISGRTIQPKHAALENSRIDLVSLFDPKSHSFLYTKSSSTVGRTAYLFAEIEVPRAGQLLIGAGADWWMQWFLDGICVYDTINPDSHGHAGNGAGMFGINNHAFTVDLDPGKHVLAVRVMGGSQGWLLCSGCGQAVRDAQTNALQIERDYALATFRKERDLVARVMSLQASQNPLPTIEGAAIPSFEKLSSGPLRVRFLPSTSSPALIHYVVHQQADRIIRAVKKHHVADAWAPSGDLEPYIQTGWPMVITYKHDEILKHQITADDPELGGLVCRLKKEYQGKFFSFQVGEWSNYLTWDLGVFHTTLEEIPRLDRKVMYHRVLDTFRQWKQTARGHLHSVNGFCLLTHIGAEAGEDCVGIETGENIPCTQVARAFTRGAARQFGLPWTEQISQWYQNTVPSGRPMPLTDMTPGNVHPTLVGEHTGHSVSLLSRMWLTAWFSGAAAVNIEAASGYLFNVAYNDPEFPDDTELSEYGKWAQKLYHLMKTHDIGVPYTPFAVLLSKYHGRMTFWRESWRHFPETTGDMMTVRFFDQIFPGQSMGPGFEQRYLCPSPYGDTFDVFVNDAERSALSAYPVIFVPGDVEWTGQDVDFLQQYVRNGGILCLNEINLNGWDRKFLGLEYDRFQPASGARTVLARPDGAPCLIQHPVDRGTVFASALKSEPTLDAEMACPNVLLRALAQKFLPFQVQGCVETLINRTAAGWAVMLVNNQGVFKTRLDAPVIDPADTQTVRLSWTHRAFNPQVLLGPAVTRDGNNAIVLTLPPGQIALLSLTDPQS